MLSHLPRRRFSAEALLPLLVLVATCGTDSGTAPLLSIILSRATDSDPALLAQARMRLGPKPSMCRSTELAPGPPFHRNVRGRGGAPGAGSRA